MQFPLLGLARDFHPLDNAHAEHTPRKGWSLIATSPFVLCITYSPTDFTDIHNSF